MEIYNCKEISVINIENTRKETKEEMLIRTISDLMLESKRKNNFNMQLVKMITDLNVKITQMEGK